MQKLKNKNKLILSLIAVAAIAFAFLFHNVSYAAGANDLQLKGLKAKDNAAVTATEVSIYKYASLRNSDEYDIENDFVELELNVSDLVYFYDHSATTIEDYIKGHDYIHPLYTIPFDAAGDAVFNNLDDGIYVILQANPASIYYPLKSSITIPPMIITVPNESPTSDSASENNQVISYIKYSVKESANTPTPNQPQKPQKDTTSTPLTVDNVIRWIAILICCTLGVSFVLKTRK